MKTIDRVLRVATCLLATSALAHDAFAQDYPAKPVRIVVPFPPGGPVDFAARTVGSRLAAEFGQPVVIDNRPGAAGIIGADLVAKATADGYTLLLTTGTMSTTPYFYKTLPYDTVRDFTPVTMVVRNTGDRPIQVGSHYHFAETNSALTFDRAAARTVPTGISSV